MGYSAEKRPVALAMEFSDKVRDRYSPPPKPANNPQNQTFLVPASPFILHNSHFLLPTMLQDTQTIRYYQRLTDALVEMWNRGYRFDDLRLYLDGYLAALRQTSALEPFHIHRLEEEVSRYIYDPSNFEMTQTQTQPKSDYY